MLSTTQLDGLVIKYSGRAVGLRQHSTHQLASLGCRTSCRRQVESTVGKVMNDTP